MTNEQWIAEIKHWLDQLESGKLTTDNIRKILRDMNKSNTKNETDNSDEMGIEC